MTRKPLLFLKDILSAIERIESYTRNGKSEFLNSSSLQDATLFRLQTISSDQAHRRFSSIKVAIAKSLFLVHKMIKSEYLFQVTIKKAIAQVF
ncbi:MAG: hypothetical protein AAFY63_02565 [Cyanobacteria bacterium J06643_13]